MSPWLLALGAGIVVAVIQYGWRELRGGWMSLLAAALRVLAGIALSLWRRMLDRGAQAVQSFGMDFLPIILLFALSITGLALTASTLWGRGAFYGFLSILHAITVIAA